MTKTSIEVTSGYDDRQDFGTTRYYAISGYIYPVTNENWAKCRIHDTLTAKNLYVRVFGNTLNNATTLRTRKNGANGTQSVSIPAGATGEFEDTVNTDSLASGNDFNYQAVTGGTTGIITFTIFSCTLDHATVQTSILCQTWVHSTGYVTGNTYYMTINGMSTKYVPLGTESAVQFTIRFATQLSRLNAYVSSNTVVNPVVVRTRKNGADGAQSISIPSGGSGYFENGVNVDNLVSGDIIDLQIVAPSGGKAGACYIEKIQMRMITSAADSFLLYSGDPIGAVQNWGTYRYVFISGYVRRFTTESPAQLKTRAVYLLLNNLFVRVNSNAHTNPSTAGTRKNGAFGNLSVSIPGGATGVFEDNVHQDTILVGDEINYGFTADLLPSGASSILSVKATVTGAPPPTVESAMISAGASYLLRRRL